MERRGRRDELGFTLIELMVVVLIIAILIAIAIPTFLGARERANDRAAQSNVRNALTAELVFYADAQGFTPSPAALIAIEPSLTYTNDISALPGAQRLVYATVFQTDQPADSVILGTTSKSGRCFWLRNIGDQNLPRFATNACNGVPAVFADAW